MADTMGNTMESIMGSMEQTNSQCLHKKMRKLLDWLIYRLM